MTRKRESRPVSKRKRPRRRRAKSRANELRQGVHRTQEVRRVAGAIKRFARAQDAAVARGADLLAVAGSLKAAAIGSRDDTLVQDLVERQLLRDILAWREALAKAPRGSLPEDLECLRLLPDTLVQWLGERFGLEPTRAVGEELELPVSQLGQFACDSCIPADAAPLVRVRVVAAGWKRSGKVLIPPQVQLVK